MTIIWFLVRLYKIITGTDKGGAEGIEEGIMIIPCLILDVIILVIMQFLCPEFLVKIGL